MDMEITFPGGKKVDANFKGFTINTDQPVHGGGDNSAPAPFDYFLASIGTCAGIYVLSFCQQRGILTDNIKIVQKIVPDASGRGIGTIELEIQVPSDFPGQYKSAVIRSADLCAVKKYLHNPPKFEIYTKNVD
ncbi:OsmC family protein [candidate division KSB1 bacterium]|nr:OsmC family protein [candidate division KSB1 bacterium]MBL7094939.1 OsmC family protein [candidate division KSB1 bacterium]